MKIQAEDIPKTTFKTLYGHCKFLVMTFGSTNAPTTLMNLMNHVARPYLNSFLIVFIDDILPYSRNREEHIQNLRIMFQILRDHRYFTKFSKCDIYLESVTFLRYAVSKDGIILDLENINFTNDW